MAGSGPNISSCFALLIALTCPQITHADTFCTSLKALVTEARSNFADSPPVALKGAQSCRLTRNLAAPDAYFCAWDFPYRAPKADQTFARFNQSAQTCFDDLTALDADQPVNHPDSYDLRQYRLGDINLSVSLKDKTALQKTYVFIRISAENTN